MSFLISLFIKFFIRSGFCLYSPIICDMAQLFVIWIKGHSCDPLLFLDYFVLASLGPKSKLVHLLDSLSKVINLCCLWITHNNQQSDSMHIFSSIDCLDLILSSFFLSLGSRSHHSYSSPWWHVWDLNPKINHWLFLILIYS